MHPGTTPKAGLRGHKQLRGEIRVPFLLDVHFRSLDFQGVQCLEFFSLNIRIIVHHNFEPPISIL